MSSVTRYLLFGFACTLVISCVTKVVADEVTDPEDFAGIAEALCKSNPQYPCGHVYAFDTPADTQIGLIEMCIPQPYTDPATGASRPTLQQAETMYGASALSPSPRFSDKHSWLCWWCCGPGCTAGCNAYSGCYCLDGVPRTFEPMPDEVRDAIEAR